MKSKKSFLAILSRRGQLFRIEFYIPEVVHRPPDFAEDRLDLTEQSWYLSIELRRNSFC